MTWSKRGPFLLIGIIALLVFIGVEITEGLGWLTVDDWIKDFLSLIYLFAGVIFAAVFFALLLGFIRKPKSSINWQQFNSQEGDENEKE